MRLLLALLIVFSISVVGLQGDDLLRDAKYAANGVTRDVNHWVTSILP